MEQRQNINSDFGKNIQSVSTMEFNWSDLLYLAYKRWYYYVLALIVCGIGAYVYVHRTAPTYQRISTVLIKDKNDGSRTLSEAQLFKEVGLANIASNVENEILMFKSLHLAEMVVRQLHLDVCYQKVRLIYII